MNEFDLLQSALARLSATDPTWSPGEPAQGMEAVLMEAAERLRDNYPYASPLYAGQMLKPPHPIARLAYSLAMYVNPNNHALDGGRASSQMEREAVAHLAHMIGWDDHLGHLTGGGTLANLEALWIAGQISGKRTILASDQCHYTHPRMSAVLGLPFEQIPSDSAGKMDLPALRNRLRKGDVGTVIATLGTTATGSVDPLEDILALRAEFGFRVHCDAAYGGYFTLASSLPSETRGAFDGAVHADSFVIDPHKHGLQPYGCGCILFRDPAVGRFYKHDSPYTYFTSNELHLGEISLECSRAGAAAVALWATQRHLPCEPQGEFAWNLDRCRAATLDLHCRLSSQPAFLTAFPPELDIVVWAVRGTSTTECSRRARELFNQAAERGLHLALAELPVRFFDFDGASIAVEGKTVTCLRSCLMKPEHKENLDLIWEILMEAVDD